MQPPSPSPLPIKIYAPGFSWSIKAKSSDPAVAGISASTCSVPTRSDAAVTAISVGSDADICVFLPKDQIWDSKNANDELNWSPLDGCKFNGQVSKTFLRGECVWDGKKFLLGEKTGQFIPRGNSNFFDYY